jgi:hypothetical protein
MSIADNVLDPKYARAIFAHEFQHMIQFSYARGSACAEYRWIDEGTANWAIEHVFQLGLPWLGSSSNNCLGSYCKYPFFLYIAKRFGEDRIRRIHQASEKLDPIDSVAAAIDGSLRDVWHDFSLALYNDVQTGIDNRFFAWDSIEDGIRATTFDQRYDGLAVVEMTLDGQAERAANLNQVIKFAFSCRIGDCSGSTIGYNPLYRLSTRPISLKFSDEAVSYAVLYNPYAGLSTDVKIWALQRVNGAWKAPEDWTTLPWKTYCRDRNEERIEELVLIYSNGDATSRGQTGEWYVELDEDNEDDDFGLLPQVALSNAGCWKWRGSASATTVLQPGLVRTESAHNVVLERRRPPQAPDGAPTTEGFAATSAVVTIEQSGTVNPVCTMQLGPATAANTEQQHGGLGGFTLRMADIDRATDEEFDFDRRAIGSGVGWVTATTTVRCDGQDPIVTTQLHPVSWMVMPLEGVRLSADGRRLSGTFTVQGVITVVLDFVAERE